VPIFRRVRRCMPDFDDISKILRSPLADANLLS
jgi:hypothetical protein